MKSKMERVTGRGYSSQNSGLGAFSIGLVLALMAPMLAWSQSAVWIPPGATGNIYYNGGYVGIGTPSPVQLLDVRSQNAVPPVVAIASTVSSFGSQTTQATISLGVVWTGNGFPYQMAGIDGISEAPGDSSFGAMRFTTRNAGTVAEKMRITSGGFVGIGTANPQHQLQVAGTIGAQEVIVSSTGADYVFDPDYKLKSLSEVAEYVAANRHLPEIPSAEEVQKQGIGVGEMQTKLLAKIEELTLHMIQAEKENKELRERLVRVETSVVQVQADPR